LELHVQTTPTFQIVATSRIFDSSATNPRFYYLPSLAVNTRRSGSGVWMPSPIPYLAGQQYTSLPGGFAWWGDCSYTSVDPDGLRIWTIQEYAVGGDYWGTQVAAIMPFAGGP
jgi:hypothetical protein